MSSPKIKFGGGAPSLQQIAEQRVLDDLKAAVRGYQATANFCLGGNIPLIPNYVFSTSGLEYGSSKKPIAAPPTVVRFDLSDGGMGKVQFPLPIFSSTEESEGDAHDGKLKQLDELLQACSPATFGWEGKDVLDESYRKAGKLDRSQFAVDFHPHDYGIVDAIAQTLLPSFGAMKLDGENVSKEHWGVVAELYKLNASFFQECWWIEGTMLMFGRYTRGRRESSRHMLIRRAGRRSLGVW